MFLLRNIYVPLDYFTNMIFSNYESEIITRRITALIANTFASRRQITSSLGLSNNTPSRIPPGIPPAAAAR